MIHLKALCLSLWILLLAACRNGSPPAATPAPLATPPGSPRPTFESAATALSTAETDETSVREVSILYTNDEHGWMQGMASGAGAANLVGLWRELEGYSDGSHLLLSGGDMWTGPAISTWFDGQSMVEVMNEMGYTAAAIGNHEFDFGLAAFKSRAEESNFPLISANLRYRHDGTTPVDLAVQPYVVTTFNEVRVGIIGLTTTSTPYTTHPRNVAEFEFLPYEAAIRETMPLVKDDGAELILVVAHVCRGELETLVGAIGDLGIDMLGGGHCNELFAEEINGTILVGGGFQLTSYARIAFQFDTDRDMVLATDYDVRENEGGVPDPAVAAIAAHWQAKVEAELDVVIGYTERGIQQRSQAMQDLITESWLFAYPEADAAITNLGGMRAALPLGDITLSDVIGVMPFDNVLIEVRLTGKQLLQILAFAVGDAAIGGAHQQGSQWVLDVSGDVIEPEGNYSILVNDFMYAGGDGYEMLADFDPVAYDTAIDWRQPVIDWIEAQDSTAANPIEAFVSRLGRP